MATIDNQAFASVERFMAYCASSGLLLTARRQHDDDDAVIVVHGAQAAPAVESFITQHRAEIAAILKSRPTAWRLAAERKIAATLDSLRSWRQTIAWEWPVEFEDFDEWENASALIEVALLLHSDTDLNDALDELANAFMRFYIR